MERDEGALPEEPATLAGVLMGALAQCRLRGWHAAEEGRQVIRLKQDPEPVGGDRPAGLGPPSLLHRPLDPTAELLGLDGGAEEAADRPFYEAFEEPLERGQGRGHGVERI
jgi:hypothetical protein